MHGSNRCEFGVCPEVLLDGQPVLLAPVSRRDAVNVFKGPGKMKLVIIADGGADVSDGQLGQL